MIHDKHYKTEKARRQGKNQKNKAQKRNWFTRVRVLFFARRAFAQPHRAARAGPAIARRSPLRAGARQACSTVRGEGSKHPGKPHRAAPGCAMPSLPRAPGRCAPKGPAGPTQATGPPCPPARFALLPFPGRGGTPAAQSPARGRLAARGAKLICLWPGAGPGLFSGCKGRKIHGRKLFVDALRNAAHLAPEGAGVMRAAVARRAVVCTARQPPRALHHVNHILQADVLCAAPARSRRGCP